MWLLGVLMLTDRPEHRVRTAQRRRGASRRPIRCRPAYELLRDEEDWSFLDRPISCRRTRGTREIPPDSLAARLVSVAGGEVRQQYERFGNEEWGGEPRDDNGYTLQRYMFHADARLGPRARLFGQLKSGIEIGRVGGPRGPDEDRLDIHQVVRGGQRRAQNGSSKRDDSDR